MKLVRKDTKVAIVATKELLVGSCAILENSFSPDGAGSFDFNHGFHGTEIDWDSQRTATFCGNVIFIDENGEEVWEENCELIEDQLEQPPCT